MLIMSLIPSITPDSVSTRRVPAILPETTYFVAAFLLDSQWEFDYRPLGN